MAKNKDKKIQDFFAKHSFSAESLLKQEKNVLQLSPRLHELTNGIQMGSLMLMSGKEKSGKTTTALHIAAKAQQQFGSKVHYCNAECRLQNRDIKGCHDLDKSEDKFNIIQPEIGEILYAEDYLNCIRFAMQTEDNIVVILDSVSNMAAKDLLDDDITRRYRDSVPNMMSNFTKAVASLLRKDIILIFILHEIANVDPRAYVKWQQSGGNKIKFANNYNIRVSHSTAWEENEETIGQINYWHCLNTATGVKGRSIESMFRYDYGIDETAELFNVACELFIIKNKGAGYFEYNGENLPRTGALAVEYLKNNKDLYNEITAKINEVYNG